MVYNPYRRAGVADTGGMSPREIEASAFAMVNRALREARTPHERVLALGRNHDLWSIILKDVASERCALPSVLRDDILRLGLFSTRRSLRAMGESAPSLAALLEINADMEAALRPAAAAPSPRMSVPPLARVAEHASLAAMSA